MKFLNREKQTIIYRLKKLIHSNLYTLRKAININCILMGTGFIVYAFTESPYAKLFIEGSIIIIVIMIFGMLLVGFEGKSYYRTKTQIPRGRD